mmetsp:Transcript_284/g.325  ORF Transcript_284/g.325 Transcript_284/m.325 type:complete len:806 (+) Transcript_284:288-2705(+)
MFGAVYGHTSKDEGVKSASALLEKLNVSELLVLSNDLDKKSAIYSKSSEVDLIVLVDSSCQESFDAVISRNFKPLGVKAALLDLSAKQVALSSSSLVRAKMLKEGYFYLYTPKATWASFTADVTGPLIMVEAGTKAAGCDLEYDLMGLEWVISHLPNSKTNFNMNAEELRAAIASRPFTLFNVVRGQKVEVGEISGGNVSLTGVVVYPGSTTTLKQDFLIPIRVSTISSDSNPDGTLDPFNAESFIGAFYAFEEIKQSKLLNRFFMEPQLLDCGAIGYNPTFQKSCLAKYKESLGVAIIAGYSSGHTIGILEGLYYNGIKTPVIGARSASSALSDRAKFPTYVRITKTSVSLTPSIVQFLRMHQFSKVNLFHSGDLYGRDFYSYMLIALAHSHIEIVTPEHLREIPLDLTVNSEQYTGVAEAVLKSEVRPTVFLLTVNYRIPFLNMFYQAGIRRDFIFCINFVQDKGFWTTGTPEEIERRMELIAGSVMFESSAYIGTLGAQVHAGLEGFGIVEPNVSQCQFYDSVYLLAFSLRSMIFQGKDFEDPAQLILSMRDTDFYGCSGRVAIDRDSNDRKDQDIDAYNIISLNDTYSHKLIYRFAMSKQQAITQFGHMVWPSGEATPPRMNRFNIEDCPFPEETRHQFSKGVTLVEYLSGAYLVVALVSSCVILCTRTLCNAIHQMQSKVVASFNDRMMFSFVLIYCLQYIGHGPKLKEGLDNFHPLIDYASGGSLGAIKFEKGIYWTVLNTSLSLVVLWIVFAQLIWLNLKGLHFKHLTWFNDAGEASMPLLGNLLFLPINSLIFDVFV